MKVLVACELSQVVTAELRVLGIEAYSCDVLPTRGKCPEWHLQCDVRDIINDSWEMILAFPPCTHLASSGARWFKQKRKDGRQQQGIDLFMLFANASCEKVAIENPIGIMSSVYRKPDQIIHPFMFGDPYRKSTCLWLKGLSKLIPTDIVDEGETVTFSSGRSMPKWYSNIPPGKERSFIRGKTFPGIAKAMATQWGLL